MTMPLAADDFNRGNGGLGANWTTVFSTFAPAIVSNQCNEGTVNQENDAFWSARTWPNDQWTQVSVVVASGSGDYVGTCARTASGSVFSSYVVYVVGPLGASALIEVYKTVSGASTLLASATFTVAANDVIRLAVEGTTLRAYQNGVLRHGPLTDSALASGSAGVAIYNSAGAAQTILDNWQGGDFSFIEDARAPNRLAAQHVWAIPF